MQVAALAGWSALFLFYEATKEHDAIPREVRVALFVHAVILGIINGAVGVTVAPFGPAAVGGSSITMFVIGARTGRYVATIATRKAFGSVDNAQTETERVHPHAETEAD